MQSTITDLINGIIAGIDTTAEDVIIASIAGTETTTYTPDATTYTIISSGNYIKLEEEIDEFDINALISVITSGFVLPQSGVMLIGTEEIKWTSFINDAGKITLYDLTRGFNSTTPAIHLIDTTAEVKIIYSTVVIDKYEQTITLADSTAIMAWRLVNYEDAYNQAIRSKQGIVVTDSGAPYYPVKDYNVLLDEFEDTVMTFDSTCQYTISTDATSGFPETEFFFITGGDYKYIEYEYNSQRVFAGVSYLFPYFIDSTSITENQVSFFIGLSKDGNEWIYNYRGGETTDIEVAKTVPFSIYTAYYTLFGINLEENNIKFYQPRKAKYIRFYFLGATTYGTYALDIPNLTISYDITTVNNYITIARLTYEEVVQGQRIRDITIPPKEKLTSTTIASQLSGTISSSSNITNTNWTTIGSMTSTISSISTLNEECRIERGTQTGTLYARIYDPVNASVIDTVTLTSATNVAAQLFNRNLSLTEGEEVTRYIQLKVSTGANITYATRYQSTRYGY